MIPRALVVVAAVAVLGGAWVDDALATGHTGPGTTGEVLAIEGIVDAERDASVTARVANDRDEPVGDVRLRLTVHDQTRSRYALAEAVDGQRPGPARHAVESRRRDLGPQSASEMRLRASAAELGLAHAAPGVYPATVSLLDEHGTAEELVTALVVPPSGGEPVRLSVLATFQGPVAMRAEERYEDPALQASARRATRLADALPASLPVTVAIDGRTVDEMRALANGELQGVEDPDLAAQGSAALEALGAVAARPETETVALPYGPADLVAITRAGLASEAQRLVDRGQAVVGVLAGARPGRPVVVPVRGLDGSTAGWLSGLAAGTVLSEAHLGLDPLRDMPSTPPAVRTLAGIPELPVAVPDPLLSSLLSGTVRDLGPPLAAQRVLAESAAVFFERPGGQTPRGLLLAPTRGQAAHLLPAMAAHIDAAAWLEPVPLRTLLDEVPADPRPQSLAYRSHDREAELPTGYVRTVHEASERLESIAGVLGDEAVTGHSRRLDTALSVSFRGAPLRGHGRRVAAAIQGHAERLQHAVAVMEGPPLTLTGREGSVPVTLVNREDAELNVKVKILTNRYEVEDEDGRDLVLPPEEEVTTTFDVRAHVPGGTYPVVVEVTDPGGRLGLASGQVAVRSTAASVAGRTVTGGAALFLLASVLHALVRRRRRQQATAADEASADQQPASMGGKP